jgi:hypothetical protein
VLLRLRLHRRQRLQLAGQQLLPPDRHAQAREERQIDRDGIRCTFRRPHSRATSTTSGSSAASAIGSTTSPRRLTSTRAPRPRPTSLITTSTAQPTRSASTRRSCRHGAGRGLHLLKNTHPIGVTTDLCLIAVKARKTKIETISGEFTSRARLWDGVAWGSTYEPTNNPAALYREVLLGSLNAQPLASTLVDAIALGDAYNDCQSNGYVANGVIQGYSVEQALQEIAATCRGVPRQEENGRSCLSATRRPKPRSRT